MTLYILEGQSPTELTPCSVLEHYIEIAGDGVAIPETSQDPKDDRRLMSIGRAISLTTSSICVFFPYELFLIGAEDKAEEIRVINKELNHESLVKFPDFIERHQEFLLSLPTRRSRVAFRQACCALGLCVEQLIPHIACPKECTRGHASADAISIIVSSMASKCPTDLRSHVLDMLTKAKVGYQVSSPDPNKLLS